MVSLYTRVSKIFHKEGKQMMWRYVKVLSGVFVAVLSIAMFSHATSAGVKTDKNTYSYGESIKVTFSGATGLDSDWLCIVPAGSPSTEAGDYKYMPKGLTTGTLTFDAPAPGKYEVRVFYNYHKVGYVVAANASFSVTGNAAYAKDMVQRMERKINSDILLEAAVPSGKGLVYIFREPWSMSSVVDVEITSNNKPVVILANSDYHPFVASPGKLLFKTGTLFQADNKSTVAGGRTGEAEVNVKPGHVYYLRVKVLPLAYYDNYLDNMPHQEGAELIRNYKLNLRK